jgi:hypothetical protein
MSINFASNHLPKLLFTVEKLQVGTSKPYSVVEIASSNNNAMNTLSYASDSTIVTDSILWIGGYQKGKILSGKLNVIYNSKIGILKFENNDTLWKRIPNN